MEQTTKKYHRGLETGNKKSQEGIEEPTNLDILCGKDHISICHPGSRCFHALVGFSSDEFKVLSTLMEKNTFVNAIVKSILSSGGRFLRRQPNDRGWEQVDLKVMKEKVRHAFRDFIKRRRKLPKRCKEGLLPASTPYYHSAGHFDWKGIVTHMMNAESSNRMNPHDILCEPTDLDVLHGRDNHSVRHVGNICFRTMIGYSLEHYVILTNRSEKREFLSAIVDAIHNSGGRFLRRRLHGGGWEQDDIHKAKATVGQALRDVIKKHQKKHNCSSLMDVSDLSCHYKTAYDFDWRRMVRKMQLLQSETKNSSSRANVDVNWEVDISSTSDLPLTCLLSREKLSFLDYLSMDSFHEQEDIPSSVSLARL